MFWASNFLPNSRMPFLFVFNGLKPSLIEMLPAETAAGYNTKILADATLENLSNTTIIFHNLQVVSFKKDNILLSPLCTLLIQ